MAWHVLWLWVTFWDVFDHHQWPASISNKYVAVQIWWQLFRNRTGNFQFLFQKDIPFRNIFCILLFFQDYLRMNNFWSEASHAFLRKIIWLGHGLTVDSWDKNRLILANLPISKIVSFELVQGVKVLTLGPVYSYR